MPRETLQERGQEKVQFEHALRRPGPLDTKLFLVRISRETEMSLPIKLLQSEAVTKIYISLAGSDTLMAFPEPPNASQNSVNGHGAMAAF
jgi:hypothetical protein